MTTASKWVIEKRSTISKTPKIVNMMKQQVAQKKQRQRFETMKYVDETSMAKSTPPIGAPNVAVTPAAIAAE